MDGEGNEKRKKSHEREQKGRRTEHAEGESVDGRS